MDSELQALEERVRQAADLILRVREENAGLRQRIAALETENKRLAGKVESAAQKVESLLARMGE
jgi:cell division protein ZapB